ncbi:MAG: hypothetical protein ACN4GR_01530 [Arenicellales bacterium]
MKITRWLLCHLLLITLLISFGVIFSFWDELKSDFTRLTGGIAQEEVNQLEKLSTKLDVETVVTEKKQESSIAAEPATVIEVESRAAQPQKKAGDPWSTVLDGANVQAGKEARPAADIPLESAFPPENYDPESSVVVDNNTQPMGMSASAKAAPRAGDIEAENSAAAGEYFSALEEARRLYWEGKAGLAQEAYESLMFKYQDMPEAAAELGNLLLQQGNQNGATWAYKNAIPRYLNLHREQEAISIMKLLSQYDPAIAEKLQKKYW